MKTKIVLVKFTFLTFVRILIHKSIQIISTVKRYDFLKFVMIFLIPPLFLFICA